MGTDPNAKIEYRSDTDKKLLVVRFCSKCYTG